MDPANWSWMGVVVAILLYWVGAASLWVLHQRRRVRDLEPTEVQVLSDTETLVSFEISLLPSLPWAAVLLGPPLALIILVMA